MNAFLRATRSLLFLAVYFLFLVVTGFVQRFVVWPLTVLRKPRRVAIVGTWFRLMANGSIGLSRIVAGVRLDVQGSIPPGSCVAVMNHQSLLDIPIAYSLVGPPYPLIPTRALYAWGIPLISLLIRLGRLPLVHQKKETRRRDVLAIVRAVEAVEKGELSMLIFPEGHRTRDGEIGPFMKAGLRSVLERARRPVYVVVVDGFWRARTTSEAILHYAGIHGMVRVSGPFAPPAEAELDGFIDELRQRMCAELDAMRGRAPVDQGRAEMAK
jgi:1-acyl-sn-glycerol-3-phosphate acyltransferase